MNSSTIFRHKPKKRRHKSRKLSASIRIASIAKGISGTVPVVGSFVKGVIETAELLVNNLEQFKDNKEDMQDLVDEIIDIVVIVRKAGIEVSAVPESIECAADLRKICVEFQEFLCNLSQEVNEINRNRLRGGFLRNTENFLTSHDVKESISHYRKHLEDARADFLLRVAVSSNASLARIQEQISSIQSDIANQVLPCILTLSTANDGNTVSDETQILRQHWVPGGINAATGIQEMRTTAQSGRAHSEFPLVSRLFPGLAKKWLRACQLELGFAVKLWWYLRFEWSLSLKFEISPATPSRNDGGSRTWTVLIGIDAYPNLPLRGCVADALLMQRYVIEHLGVPEGRIQLLIGSHQLASTGLSPTRNNIVKTLSSLITNPDIQPGDEIIIYFSGHEAAYLSQDSDISAVEPRGGSISSRPISSLHGSVPSSIIALRPIDSDGPDGLDISDREISTILHLISSSRKARITLILDCGRSGGFSTGNLPQRTEALQPGHPLFHSIPIPCKPIDMSINMLNAGHETLKHFPGYQSIMAEDWRPNTESYVLLAACQDFQPAIEMESPSRQTYQGLFTGTLVRALTSNVLKDRSTFVDLLEALRPLMQYEQAPVVIGKYKDAPIWFRD